MNSPREPHFDAASPAPHVDDLAIDFAEGRLDTATTRRVQAHLDGCDECRTHYAFAQAMYRQTLAAKLRHVAPERLVLLAENAELGPTDVEFAHMEACELCRRQLDWARSMPPPAELRDEVAAAAPASEPAGVATPAAGQRPAVTGTARAAAGRGLRLRPALFWRLGAMAAAVATLIVLMRPAGQQQVQQATSLVALARIEPLAVRVQRAGGDPESFEALSARGLAAYRDGDYAQAIESLGRAALLNDQDAAAQLYLCSALLQLERAEEGIPHLQRAALLSDSPVVDDNAQWLLANACLRLEDADCAGTRLRAVVALGGAHASAAQRALRAMGAR